LACLRPGGCAIHTTEYNVSSNDETADYRSTVIYRRCDLERIAANLRDHGQYMAPLDLQPGDLPMDQVVDVPPYTHDPHLKLLLKKRFVCTSAGMVIEKHSDRIPQAPRYVTPRTLRAFLRPWGQRFKQTLYRFTAGRRRAS
jgi:hypothetical protein